MIWFAGILLNTSCNNDNKNKTKNIELWVGCLLTQLRALSEILKVSRQCVLLTNFSFRVLVLRNHIFFRFLDSTAPFFYTKSKHGAPSQDLTRPFFLPFPFFGCVLEETHGATFLEVASEVLSAGRNFYIRVIVIEFYVIKSWWKIKFKKQKRYSSACFFSFKPALTNLNKFDFVVTEFLFGNKQ